MADKKSEVVDKKKGKSGLWRNLGVIAAPTVFLVMVVLFFWVVTFVLLPGLFLKDIHGRAFRDAEKVVTDLALVANENDLAPIQSELDSIETSCSREYSEWQECMASYRELNRLVHDYYEQHSSELDVFDPYLKDDIADLDQSTSQLEAEYARFRASW